MNDVQESWRYSNISCTTYPLAPLDTIGPEGQTSQYFIKKTTYNIHVYASHSRSSSFTSSKCLI